MKKDNKKKKKILDNPMTLRFITVKKSVLEHITGIALDYFQKHLLLKSENKRKVFKGALKSIIKDHLTDRGRLFMGKEHGAPSTIILGAFFKIGLMNNDAEGKTNYGKAFAEFPDNTGIEIVIQNTQHQPFEIVEIKKDERGKTIEGSQKRIYPIIIEED